MRTGRAGRLAALALLAGCAGATAAEPEYRREPAHLTWAGIDAEVQVPAEVQAGTPFTVRVMSVGGSCRREAPTVVARGEMRADVSVFVLQQVDGFCDRGLRGLAHETTLTFPRPGTATVRIHGLAYEPGGPGAPLTVERTVTVR